MKQLNNEHCKNVISDKIDENNQAKLQRLLKQCSMSLYSAALLVKTKNFC